MQNIKQQRVVAVSKDKKKIKAIKAKGTYVAGRGNEKIEQGFDKKSNKLAKKLNTIPK